MIVKIDISCVDQLSINCSYFPGEIYTFKLYFAILYFPFVFKRIANRLYLGFIFLLFHIYLFLHINYQWLCPSNQASYTPFGNSISNLMSTYCRKGTHLLFSANYSTVFTMFHSTIKREKFWNLTIFVLSNVI